MAGTVRGRLNWGLDISDEGYRDYRIDWLVEMSNLNEGPLTGANTAGLAAIGAPWTYGGDNDAWALCRPEMGVQPVIDRDPTRFYIVTQMFSNRPMKRCQTNQIDNPILEPAQISGAGERYTEEMTEDANGKKLLTSSLEQYRGASAERDRNRPTVQIGINISTLNLAVITGLIDHLNDSVIWGLQPGQAKFSDYRWRKLYYGTCTPYYNLVMDFDVRPSWTRELLDEGTRYLDQGGDPNKPEDYVTYKDKRGENQKILLDGNGGILTDAANPVFNDFEPYPLGNLLLLGIPTTL